MNSNQRNAAVLLVTLAVAGGASAAWLVTAGVSETSLSAVLRGTAHAGLLLYLTIFIARPLGVLHRSPVSRWLLSNRRYLGIAFATVMLVHLVLILWLRYGVTGQGIQPLTVIVGIVAYAFIVAMLVTSWDATTRALGPRRWKRLHHAGLFWIGLPFAATIADALSAGERPALYGVLTALIVIAVVIRLMAWFRRRSRDAVHLRVPGA